MSDRSTFPGPVALDGRYRTARVLRTRATGTPFRVRWDGERLVVTTVAGHDRDVALDEIVASWPHIERGAPKYAWKHLSNNTSYLESIYDDIRGQGADVQDAPTSPAAVRVEGRSAARAPDHDLAREVERLRAEIATAKSELRTAQGIARAAQVTREEQLDSERRLQRELAFNRGEDRLKAELGNAREEVERLRAELADARREATLGRAAGSVANLAALRATNQSLVSDLGTARRLLGEARNLAAAAEPLAAVKAKAARQAADARRKLEAASAALTDAHREASEARHSLEEERRARNAAETAAVLSPTTMEVRIDAGKLRYSKNHVVDGSVSTQLASAASQIFTNPNAAVADCRRALERSVELLWTSVTARPRDRSVYMSQMLADLYDHPSFPAADFHLAKNLYARASGVVHDGGGEADAALWIWLGVVQIAELVSVATSRGDGTAG